MSKEQTQTEIMDMVFQAGRLMRRRMMELKGSGAIPENMSQYQVQALFTLLNHASTMGELAEEMNISLPSATSLVDRLVKGDWVVREPDPNDRRIIRLSATERGQKLCAEMRKKRAASFKSLLDIMSEEDVTALHRILTNLNTTLEKDKRKES